MWNRQLPYSYYFIGNYMFVIISCHLCWLLFSLYKISTKTKTFTSIKLDIEIYIIKMESNVEVNDINIKIVRTIISMT